MIKNTLKIFALLFLTAVISKIGVFTIANAGHIPLYSVKGLTALIYGTRFDATIAALYTAPIFLLMLIGSPWKKSFPLICKIWAIITSFLIILSTFSDATYFQEASKHVTFELFTAQGMESELLETAIYSHTAVFFTGIIFALINIFIIVKWIKFSNSHTSKLMTAIFALVWVAITVFFIRGGFDDQPQSPMSAYKIGNRDQAFIAWSAPYSMNYYLFDHSKKGAKNATKAPDQALLDKWQQALKESRAPKITNLKDANVLVVLLESWPAYDSKSYAHSANATPFFDSLRAKSLTTHATYADGFRTVQGMFATLCSYPNPNGFIVPHTQLQNERYSCLPQILNDNGWHTAFIQGSGKGIVGSFANTLGFKHSFGKKDYTFEGQHNDWGYMDDGIYKFTMQQVDKFTKNQDRPFLITVNTGTTHSTLLPHDSDYIYGKDSHIHIRRSVIHHADSSLSRFIPKLNKKLATLKRPTVVALVADHTAYILRGGFTRDSIPFLMYSSDKSIPAVNLPITSSQRDIGATILDWLGGYAPWFTGHSLLNMDNYPGRSSFYFGNGFFWIAKDKAVGLKIDDSSLAKCYTIPDNTISRKSVSCDQDWVQPLYQEAKQFNELTQHLLFKGKTMQYRHIPLTPTKK